jgi:phosphoglycolate phosphatase-like HAD superfamily hydrolase
MPSTSRITPLVRTPRAVTRARVVRRGAFLIALATVVAAWGAALAQPLPSWTEGPVKARILAFVRAVTDTASPEYVPPDGRIATFDNDGTLWSEQPLCVQLQFMLDQVKAAAPRHPEWKDNAAFKSLAAHDHAAIASLDHKPILDLVGVANAGMTTDAYDATIRSWLTTARHPRFGRPYTDLVYQPMRELLDHLRANGFAVDVVSGGSVEFMRPWVEAAYGIPPDRVIGSISRVTLEAKDGRAVLTHRPEIEFVDDGPGKPVDA